MSHSYVSLSSKQWFGNWNRITHVIIINIINFVAIVSGYRYQRQPSCISGERVLVRHSRKCRQGIQDRTGARHWSRSRHERPINLHGYQRLGQRRFFPQSTERGFYIDGQTGLRRGKIFGNTFVQLFFNWNGLGNDIINTFMFFNFFYICVSQVMINSVIALKIVKITKTSFK